MSKSPANPKMTVMRGLTAKVAPVFRRHMAELTRAQPAPATAARLADELEAQVEQVLKAELSKSGLPVVNGGTDWPADADAWVYQPLCGKRNAEHGRLPCSVQMGYVRGGKLLVGAVYFPVEDMLVIAEPGTGASQGSGVAGSRLRVSGRAEVKGTLVLLPMVSADTAKYALMEKADKLDFHTRKSGHALFDAIDVASGRADAAILTRVTPLESALAQLMVAEGGGKATALDGTTPTQTTENLLLANIKLLPEMVKVLA